MVKSILDKPAENERMATELVRLANENHIATTGRELSQPVQDFMHDKLLKAAECPPLPAQAKLDRQLAQSLGHAEPQHESALQSSLYAAQHAPHGSELLNDFTAKTEASFARQQQQAQARELEESHDLDSWQLDDDFSIDM